MLDLYKDLMIDHGNNPRNKYVMSDYTHFARGYNYLCGDKCEVYVNINNGLIQNISFYGTGCVISIASSSLMTVNLKEKTFLSGLNIFEYFIGVVTGKMNLNDEFNDLNVLSNIKRFPNRVKCATLVWHTFNNAISHENKNFNF